MNSMKQADNRLFGSQRSESNATRPQLSPLTSSFSTHTTHRHKQPLALIYTPQDNLEFCLFVFRELYMHVFGLWEEDREPTQGEHANSTQKVSGPESNPQPLCFEVAAPTAGPPHFFIIIIMLRDEVAMNTSFKQHNSRLGACKCRRLQFHICMWQQPLIFSTI